MKRTLWEILSSQKDITYESILPDAIDTCWGYYHYISTNSRVSASDTIYCATIQFIVKYIKVDYLDHERPVNYLNTTIQKFHRSRMVLTTVLYFGKNSSI